MSTKQRKVEILMGKMVDHPEELHERFHAGEFKYQIYYGNNIDKIRTCSTAGERDHLAAKVMAGIKVMIELP